MTTTKKPEPRILKRRSIPAFSITGGLRPQSGGKKNKKVRGPSLHDIDKVVHTVISAEGRWVLVDRNVAAEDHSSTARYIALSRRGFDVASRHVNGVRNIWARWPHAEVKVDLPFFTTDKKGLDFGQDDPITEVDVLT